MNKFYKYINIPNLEVVQQELLNCILHDYREPVKPHAFTYTERYMRDACPVFYSWLKPRSKLPIRLLRFYITPPGESLGAHIDGGGKYPIVPFGVNIPVAGTKDTYMTWYECAPENLISEAPEGYLGGTHPKDYNALLPVESLEILKPCVTNNAIMHGVSNQSSEYRVMFTVRWILSNTAGRKIGDCIDTTGLFD